MRKIKRTYLTISLVLGLIILADLFFLFFLFGQIRDYSQLLSSGQKQIDLLEQERKELEKIKTFYKEERPNIEKIENVFVDSETPLGFIDFLEKTASDSGLAIEIPSIKKEAEKGFFSSLTLEISLKGPFPNLMRFLEKMENSSYLIEILRTDIRRIEEKRLGEKGFEGLKSGDVTANLSIKVSAK